jgi:glycerol kinase
VILAIDQGTTGTTCLVVDEELRVHRRGYVELRQHFPQPGWVEHDPDEIWESVLAAAAQTGLDGVEAVAITNQRETTILWSRATGRPVAPAIVWQDRRTAERCRALDGDLIRERTGLVPDPYFSGTKLEWLLREHAGPGLAFGTVDSWLVWQLTKGAVHATDTTNASRTMLCGLRTLDWDDDLLALLDVDRALLPTILRSDAEFGEAELLGRRLPIRGIAGDQQAALFGQGCRMRGEAKVTYGTGSFVLVHAGDEVPAPRTATRWKVRYSSPVQHCSGSATGSACSRAPRRAKRSRGASTRPPVCRSCLRSPGSAHPGGSPMRADW